MENRILILDNSIDHRVYQPLEHWRPLLRFPYHAFRASTGELPSTLDLYSHIILTGSEASALENAGWMVAEEDLVRTAVATNKVILGSCFGHQLIARSLFGKDALRRMEKPEIGWPEIEVLQTDSWFGKSGQVLHSFVLHFDEVCYVPRDETMVLARSRECPVQGFKLKHRPVYGIQAHPEIGIVEALRLVDAIAQGALPQKQYFLHAPEPAPRDSGWIIPLMVAFQRTRPGSES
jgi:GMP synthase (glutamine-hydrolysing)